MKAYFQGGVMEGKCLDIEPVDELTFVRWYCDTYPAPGYQINHTYRKKCVINIGLPVVFYTSYTKPAIIGRPYAQNTLAQLAAQQSLAQNLSNRPYNALGIFNQ